MSRSTWNSPYHLFIAEIWMATSSLTVIFFGGCSHDLYLLCPVLSLRSVYIE